MLVPCPFLPKLYLPDAPLPTANETTRTFHLLILTLQATPA